MCNDKHVQSSYFRGEFQLLKLLSQPTQRVGVLNANKIGFWINRKGMPLGNLTSQFFANIYLNELDYFVKYVLKAKYYIRYVDDFVILHENKEQLLKWKKKIDIFLREKLKLELHPQKSKIIPLSRGIDFVGFRNFFYHKLLRKRNKRKMLIKINLFSTGNTSYPKLMESYEGFQAYSKWANSFNLRKKILKEIQKAKNTIKKKKIK